jgi:spermidine synthase
MTPSERDRLLQASRVPDGLLPLGEFGLWKLARVNFTDDTAFGAASIMFNGWPSYHVLGRMTEAKMHLEWGDIVMLDNRPELVKHLPILMNAAGRVLVSGLGLGCVVRGLLSRKQVEHVDVIEIDRQILDRIGPEFSGNDRVTLHHADALQFPLNGQRWDWAWHDLYDEHRALQILHADLIMRFHHHVRHQGAWQMPRWAKRRIRGEFFTSK